MTSSERGPAIRPARSSDCEALARLSRQLGYPATGHELERRLALLSDDDRVLVAALDGAVAGWIHLSVARPLVVEPHVVVSGLVVDETFRGRGIGRALMGAAEDLARERGLPCVRLTSAIHRTEAHRFYEALGYGVVKTQLALSRTLETEDPSTAG